MSIELTPLEEVQQYTAKKMRKIKSRFKNGAKITVIVRMPGNDDADFVMTDDTLRDAIKVLQRQDNGTKEKFVSVPLIPEPECIESMCLRYDHAFGIKKILFNIEPPRYEIDEEFNRRREATRVCMRQLYEEVVGQGFFKR
jgi:hypothetical protein